MEHLFLSQDYTFLSHKIERLGTSLLYHLFYSNRDISPLSKKIVVVPSDLMKNYLMRFLASHSSLNVITSVQFLNPQEAIKELLLGQPHIKSFPDSIELKFLIEHAIWEQLQHCYDKDLFLPLFDYLNIEEGRHSPNLVRKVSQLAADLAPHFLEYGLSNKPLEKKQLSADWQQALWGYIFQEDAPWTCPIRQLSRVSLPSTSLHIFGFSYLPKVYVDFFKRLNAQFYVLSPCTMYWGDVVSDKQRAYLQKLFREKKNGELEELESYLQLQNRLLANFGKVGKKFLSMLDEECSSTSEDYEEDFSPATMLDHLKKDMLDMENPSVKRVKNKKDFSIQVHKMHSKLREVELLYDSLLKAVSQEKELSPSSIKVFAPNIEEYAPYIHMIFGREEAPFEYTICGLPAKSQNSFLNAADHFFSLAKNRFSKESLLTLLSFEEFRNKQGFSSEDVKLIYRWVEKVHIRWGLDKSQKELLIQEEIDATLPEDAVIGSWEYGFARLFKGLSHLASDDEGLLPLEAVNLTEAETLGKFMRVIAQLKEDFRFLLSNEKKTVSFWLEKTVQLVNDYFVLTEESVDFIKHLNALRKSMISLDKEYFTFSSILDGIHRIFEKKNGIYLSSSLQAIEFHSLSLSSYVPCSITCLLGMDSESFPRKERRTSYSILNNTERADVTFPISDQDRYLLLELLFATEKFLWVSYEKISPKDNKEQDLSPIVTELLEYITDTFETEDGDDAKKEIIVDHPPYGFDVSYFVRNTPYASAQLRDYKIAKKQMQAQKEETKSLFSFAPPSSLHSLKNEDREVPLRLISKLARHPLQYYFNEVLGIYLDREEDSQDDKEFCLDPLTKYQMKWEGVESTDGGFFERLVREGECPLGVFKEVAYRQVQLEINEIKDWYQCLGIMPQDLLTIELSPLVKSYTRVASQHIFMPSLELPIENHCKVSIQGKLTHFSSKGYIVPSKKSVKEDVLKKWPLYLLGLCISSKELEINPKILFLKDGKELEIEIKSPQKNLEDFLAYYMHCKAAPSPLMPGWIEPIFVGSTQDLQKEIDKSLALEGNYVDSYFERLKLCNVKLDAGAIINDWQETVHKIYAPLAKWIQGDL